MAPAEYAETVAASGAKTPIFLAIRALGARMIWALGTGRLDQILSLFQCLTCPRISYVFISVSFNRGPSQDLWLKFPPARATTRAFFWPNSKRNKSHTPTICQGLIWSFLITCIYFISTWLLRNLVNLK